MKITLRSNTVLKNSDLVFKNQNRVKFRVLTFYSSNLMHIWLLTPVCGKLMEKHRFLFILYFGFFKNEINNK